MRYPLRVNFVQQVTAADGSQTGSTTVHQGFAEELIEHGVGGITLYAANVLNTVDSADTLDVSAAETISGHSGQHSKQSFSFDDSLSGCYRSEVAAVNDLVTASSSGKGCPGGTNHVYWFSHPDGAPDNGDVIPGL